MTVTPPLCHSPYLRYSVHGGNAFLEDCQKNNPDTSSVFYAAADLRAASALNFQNWVQADCSCGSLWKEVVREVCTVADNVAGTGLDLGIRV